MTTTTEPKLREYSDRGVCAEWLVRTGTDPQDDCPSEEYAVLTVSHHGRPEYVGMTGYCYTATLGRETILERDDGKGRKYKVRRVIIGVTVARSVRVIPNVEAKRFSRKQLDAVMEQALAAVAEARGTGGNVDAIFDPEV